MARRTSSPPHDELVLMTVEAGRAHLEDVGLQRFSLREVARRVGYTPTTIIAWFGSADLLLYRMGASALIRWRDRISAEMTKEVSDVVPVLVDAYFDFARDEPETWKALYSHQPKGTEVPSFYQAALHELATTVISFVEMEVDVDRMGEVPALVNSLLATMRGHCEAEMKGSFDLVGAGGSARSAALNTVADSLSRLGYHHG
jgi:AcrR family transcriptional regulator